MAQSTAIRLAGVLSAQPAPSSLFSGSFNELMPLDICATYGGVKGGVIRAVGTDLSPQVLPLENITRVRLFALRLLSGQTIKLRITTALGVAILNVSGTFLVHVPAVGDEITAISFVTVPAGVDVCYVIAGDTT